MLPLAVSLSGCATTVVKPAPPLPKPVPALHRGPLSDFVSAAGLRWLVLVRPQAALEDVELGAAIRQIVPTNRLDAFAESSGVDLRTVSVAAVAGFPYSTLYLAQLPPGVAALARARFGERLLSGAVTKRPHPALVRITGVIGQTPETLLTIEDRVVAIAVGDPVQAKIAQAYAEDRLKNSPSALRGAALSSLPQLAANEVAILYVPGPFANEWQRAAGGILQATVALSIALQPIGDSRIATTLCLAGAWQNSADDAAQRLSIAWTSFAHSSAGHLFGLNPSAHVTASPELLTLRVELEIAPMLRGLRASVLGDLSELLGPPPKSPAAPSTGDAPDNTPNE